MGQQSKRMKEIKKRRDEWRSERIDGKKWARGRSKEITKGRHRRNGKRNKIDSGTTVP
jgi:hypothetical protein